MGRRILGIPGGVLRGGDLEAQEECVPDAEQKCLEKVQGMSHSMGDGETCRRARPILLLHPAGADQITNTYRTWACLRRNVPQKLRRQHCLTTGMLGFLQLLAPRKRTIS